jgi:hypothetical protein
LTLESPSAASVCKVVGAASGCLQYLHQRESTRQQLLPPNFDTKINELLEMNIDAEFNTPDRLTYEPLPLPANDGTRN